jgi:transcriptional regulator with XRE-family HTH domain
LTEQRATPKTFAEKLQFLLDAVRHPSGREYNLTEIAEAINAQGQYQISRGYLSALKEGKKTTPSRQCVEAIASFFGVPPAYFYDEQTARWVEEEIRLVAALRNSPVRHISLEAFGLSESSLRVLAETIRHLRRLEGLPESSQAPAPKRRRRWRRRDEASTVGLSQGATASGS